MLPIEQTLEIIKYFRPAPWGVLCIKGSSVQKKS